MIGEVTGRDIKDRLVGTAVANFRSLQLGASILRVHDVTAAADTVAMFQCLG